MAKVNQNKKPNKKSAVLIDLPANPTTAGSFDSTHGKKVNSTKGLNPHAKKGLQKALKKEFIGDGKVGKEAGKAKLDRKRKFTADDLEAEGRQPSKKKPAEDSNKPIDWKERKMINRKVKENRKMTEKPEIYPLVKEAKNIWEELRKKNCLEDDRKKYCNQLHSLVKDNIFKLAFGRSSSKVLQCLMDHGSDQIREDFYSAFEVEKDNNKMCTLIKSRHGNHLAMKLMKYASKEQLDKIFVAMKPDIKHIFKHRDGSKVLNKFFSRYAKSVQKSVIITELYSPLLGFDSQTQGVLNEQLHSPRKSCDLSTILAKRPEMKGVILQSMQKLINDMFEKNIPDSPILHCLMHEYLENCDRSDRPPIIERMREQLINIVDTDEGSLLAMSCIWHGTPKDRKVIVKSFKGSIPKIACSKNGYRVLLALLDSVDDVVLVTKGICNDMTNNIDELVLNEYGQRTIAYMLEYRSPLFFDPEVVKLLEKGDNNEYTKKPIAERLQIISEAFCKSLMICLANNFGLWMQNNSSLLIAKLILKRYCDEVPHDVLSKMAIIIAECPSQSGIEKTAVEQLVKYILVELPEETRSIFASSLLEALKKNNEIRIWLKTNRGCFTLLRIWEKCGGSNSENGKILLQMANQNREILAENKTPGGKLLSKAVSSKVSKK